MKGSKQNVLAPLDQINITHLCRVLTICDVPQIEEISTGLQEDENLKNLRDTETDKREVIPLKVFIE